MQVLDGTFWNRIKPLLDQALMLVPEDREFFLDQACADDSRLRVAAEDFFAELERLDQGAFMESPMGDRFAALITKALEPGAGAVKPLEIGSYRTIRTLGYGGMGTVFLAERVGGEFERRVALKLIRKGAHSKAAALRFVHERQILARLQHPNIAQLHEGGTTDDGRPYFVMEYVEGTSITQYCDAHQVSIPARLGLFLQLCEALQYAHRNLVVHRDVKPSNILVTEEGQVKLLDFGIAKVLSEVGTPAVTQTGMLALTPHYAAPEQVKGEAITMVTDVYGLGLLLYELLSGHRAYRVEGASVEEWVRVICETEPVPPSQAVGQPDGMAPASEQVSTARGTTLLRLQRQLAGDLDTIVLKALRKEPERRYRSVEALSGDLERYLRNIPVLARRDTLGYRLGKFAVRHQFGVGVVVLLVLIVSGFTWRSVVEQRRAEAAAAEAVVSATQANEVSGFLVDLFTISDPFSRELVRGDTTQVRVFLERGALQIESLSDQGEVQSMLRGVLGQVYQGLGQYEESERFLRTALEQRRVLFGEQSVEAAESMHNLGQLLRLWSRKVDGDAERDVYQESEGLLREALAIRKALLGEEHPDVAETWNSLANVLRNQGEYAEAETIYRDALALRKKLRDDEHAEIAVSLNNLALVLTDQGKYAEAEPIYRDALALWKKLLGEEHPDVATSLNNLANVLRRQGHYAEAESTSREALALRKKSLGEEHPDVATSLDNLANILYNQGKYAQAEALHRDALALRKKRLGEEHPDVGASLNNLAGVLRSQGHYAEAETIYRDALALWKKLLGEEHPDVATSLNNLAIAQSNQGKYAEAEMMHREALALRRKLLGEEHPAIATSLNNLGNVLRNQGKYTEAETLHREALALRRKLLGEEHPRVATALFNLASTLSDQDEYAEAETLYREALALFKKLLGEDHPYVALALDKLGVVQREQGNYAQAETLYREALALKKKRLGEEHPDVASTLNNLAKVLIDQGTYPEAETMLLASFEIAKQASGLDHPDTQGVIDTFIALYTAWGKPEQVAHYRAMYTGKAN